MTSAAQVRPSQQGTPAQAGDPPSGSGSDNRNRAASIVPGRECGACRQCCITTDIVEIGKKAGEPCRHLVDQGCGIYENRPEACRAFECGWKTNPKYRADERPDAVGIMVMGLGLGDSAPVLGMWPGSDRLNVAHETRPGAFDSWKGQRLLKREAHGKVLALADHGKTAIRDLRLIGPPTIIGRLRVAR